ncbi:dihydrolipoyllysine-residue acetyltransferase [Deinococcus cavernae]|uniref:Dihydrolipoamide acetyltransferase component of pyruvate dehydrogenase complex n=1 Tax=Deinococcus cavernae TaxID=2320857 RepID=A0A418V6S0_9DEIO|nr:2-oxo acid dehydrogenase subunit E2 [Deinococcus cavernae]RJF71804.1 dihydrolipoyllysine-residue acetyltransferase [Deinococcus cavernae]
MATELKLPDVGDNIEKGTVVAVLIDVGDTVSEGQPIIELETDKAVVEVPATASGTVQSVNVQVGDSLPIGGVIATLGGEGAADAAQAASPSDSPSGGGGDQAANVENTPQYPDAAQANQVAAAQVASQAQQAGQTEQSQATPAAPAAASSGSQTVNLPDVGDNIEKGTVVAILVDRGDTVAEGQPIIELETDKAVVEVPSSASGTVDSVNVQVGDSVKIGAPLLTLTGSAGGVAPSAEAAAPAQGGGNQAANVESTPVSPAPENANSGTANRVAQAQQAAQQEQTKAEQAAPAGQAPGTPQVQAAAPRQAGTQNPQTFDGRTIVPAAPSVRRLAREMQVDIHAVHGTGIAGRISEEDVRRTAGTPSVAPAAQAAAPQAAPAAAGVPQAASPAPQAAPLPDFSKWGQVTREDMSGIRKATVRSMTQAWTTIPMVTQFDKADITVMEETRKRFSARVEKAGGKLTMTHIIMKVIAGALHRFPKFGASLDVAAEQVVFKDYVNIGVAVDTPVGLLVPVVKNADKKSITELVLELSELAGRARERKLKPDEMQGATFTISNLGGIGGHAFTPIVNSPEVAILGVSRGGLEPVWNKEKGEFEPRNMLPLSLTYDHRLIDGADAARFLRSVCESLEDPFLISL